MDEDDDANKSVAIPTWNCSCICRIFSLILKITDIS